MYARRRRATGILMTTFGLLSFALLTAVLCSSTELNATEVTVIQRLEAQALVRLSCAHARYTCTRTHLHLCVASAEIHPRLGLNSRVRVWRGSRGAHARLSGYNLQAMSYKLQATSS